MKSTSALGRLAFCWLATFVGTLPAFAQGNSLEDLGLRGGDGMPGVGRVVVVLLAMVALAAMAAFALRRFWPPAAQQASGGIRVRAQLALGTTLKLHFVELGETTVVVAEGRSGVSIAEIGKKQAASSSPDGGTHEA